MLQRALSAHERLERIVLSEQGLDGVTAALGRADRRHGDRLRRARGDARALRRRAPLDAEVLGRGSARRCASAPAPAPPRLRAQRASCTAARSPSRSSHARAANGDGPAPQAWLVAVKDRGRPGEFDRLVLHQAVTVVALELLRRRVADDTERRLAGDVLSAMVSGELAGSELARRLEPFGLHDRVGVLVLDPPPRSVRRSWRTA